MGSNESRKHKTSHAKPVPRAELARALLESDLEFSSEECIEGIDHFGELTAQLLSELDVLARELAPGQCANAETMGVETWSRARQILSRIIAVNSSLITRVLETIGFQDEDRPALENAGLQALFAAIRLFRFERGVKFSTYAARAIRNAALKELKTVRDKRTEPRDSMDDIAAEEKVVTSPIKLELASIPDQWQLSWIKQWGLAQFGIESELQSDSTIGQLKRAEAANELNRELQLVPEQWRTPWVRQSFWATFYVPDP
jgi:hypothetical protein